MQKKYWNGHGRSKYSTENECMDMLCRQGIQLKAAEELEEARRKAWSIGAYSQPRNPEYIGSLPDRNDTFHYFKDADGKYYYIGNREMEFEKEMETSIKKRLAMQRHGQR